MRPDFSLVGVPFDGHYGLQLDEHGEDLVRAHVDVADHPQAADRRGARRRLRASIAESLASYGTTMAVLSEGNAGLGMSNHCSFLRPVSVGTVHAEARVRHRGRTTWIWDVDLSDDEGRMCAVGRVTIAVRPVP